LFAHRPSPFSGRLRASCAASSGDPESKAGFGPTFVSRRCAALSATSCSSIWRSSCCRASNPSRFFSISRSVTLKNIFVRPAGTRPVVIMRLACLGVHPATAAKCFAVEYGQTLVKMLAAFMRGPRGLCRIVGSVCEKVLVHGDTELSWYGRDRQAERRSPGRKRR
jgi:hypothetical protein